MLSCGPPVAASVARDRKERSMNTVIVVRIADTLPCEAARL
jgi:hypothetical protein